MIQRIQTVYLLLAAFILALPVWLPYAAFTGVGGTASYDLLGAEFLRTDGSVIVSKPEFLALILTGICAATLIAAVFLFKNRRVQLATVYTAMFSQFLLLASFILTIFQAGKSLAQHGLAFSFTDSFGLLAPVIAITLSILAGKNIKKDEALVRSADRVR